MNDDTSSSTGNEFVDRVAGTLHEKVDEAAARAAPHVQRAQEGLGEARERISARADEAAAAGQAVTATARSVVREHPLCAMGMALAFGYLIARLAR